MRYEKQYLESHIRSLPAAKALIGHAAVCEIPVDRHVLRRAHLSCDSILDIACSSSTVSQFDLQLALLGRSVYGLLYKQLVCIPINPAF